MLTYTGYHEAHTRRARSPATRPRRAFFASQRTHAIGYVRFQGADYAIRHGHLPAAGRGPKLQVIGVLAFAAILIIIELVTLP
ncbi:MAG TPA: hypothetical protein VLF43_03570 [Candidatus Saccharimonadales bacterium]|nr:hypothetical protein [Candidatus Saccharimonadales bacterium]